MRWRRMSSSKAASRATTRAPPSQLRLAELMLRSKQPNSDNAARDILAEADLRTIPARRRRCRHCRRRSASTANGRQRDSIPSSTCRCPRSCRRCARSPSSSPTRRRRWRPSIGWRWPYAKNRDQYEAGAGARRPRDELPQQLARRLVPRRRDLRAPPERPGEGARSVRESAAGIAEVPRRAAEAEEKVSEGSGIGT